MSAARLDDAELLALHRALVGIPSRSGDEGAIAAFAADWLEAHGIAATTLGERGTSVLAIVSGSDAEAASAPLLLDTHLDTVPAAPAWTRDPHRATREGGRVYGLGANDAKAAVAAMMAAAVALAAEPSPATIALALVAEEETRGSGTADVLAELARRGTPPAAAVVGEPTGLDVATAQKGLLVLELVARGASCHAANRSAAGTPNAVVELARDLVALVGLGDLGPLDPWLGAVTLEPTVLRGSEARNVVPAEAAAILDVRTTPSCPPEAVVEHLRATLRGEVRVLSDRLRPRSTPDHAAIVRAALAARPAARRFGSATLSDWALLDVPAVKAGPGRSERSHTADEWVGEDDVVAGAAFYEALVRAWAGLRADEPAAAAAATAGDAAEGGR